MLKYLVFIACLAFSFSVQALDVYEWTLDINTGSKHDSKTYGRNNSKTYNETNNGIGFTFGYTHSIDIKLGYYENSYNKTSVYGGAVLNKDFYFHNDFVISPGFGFLMATGYEGTVKNAPALAPMLHPSISFGFRTLRSTIGYIPYGTNNVLTFQTQIQF